MLGLLKGHRSPRPYVILLSKPDCGLCDEAEEVARAVFGADRVTMVNIIGNRQLEDEFVFRIPVLMFRDSVLAEGRIDRFNARAALRAAKALLRSEVDVS